MTDPKPYNPADFPYGGGAAPATPQPQTEPQPVWKGETFVNRPPANVSQEAVPIDENTTVNLDNVSEELPPPEPVPNGTYDTIISGIKSSYGQKGFFSLNVTFEVASGNYTGRLVWMIISPGTKFGASRFKQLMARSLTVNQQHQQVTLLERIKGMKYGEIVSSGVCINAKQSIRTEQKIRPDQEGKPRLRAEVVDIQLPKTRAFM